MTHLTELEIQAGLFSPACEGEETAEIYRREARVLYKTDQEGAAALLLDAAYANDRDEAPIEAITRDIKLATSLCPKSPWIHAAAHRLLLKLGLWREALKVIEHEMTMTDIPNDAIALAMTACDLNWIVAEDRNNALQCVHKTLALDPNEVSALYAGLWLGNPQEQINFAENLAKILGAPPERAILYALAGNMYAAKNSETQALDCYTQAVQADRSNPYILIKYAILCEKFGKLAEAAHAWSQIAQIIDDHTLKTEFYRKAATLFNVVKQYERSAFYHAEAQKFAPHNFTITWLYAMANRQTGNWQKVIELEQQLIELSDDIDTKMAHWTALADIAFDKLKSDDLTITALENARKLGSKEVQHRLAALYETHEDWHKYAEIIEEITADEPRKAHCLTWMQADALIRNDELENAAKTLEKIPTSLGKYTLGLVLDELGEYEKHARILENWAQNTQDHATQNALISQLITLLHEKLNAPEIAIQYLDELPNNQTSKDLIWKKLRLCALLHKEADIIPLLMQFANETQDKEESLIWALEAVIKLDRNLCDFENAVSILNKIHENSPHDLNHICYLHAMAMRQKRWDLVMRANTWQDEILTDAPHKAKTARENAWCCIQMQNHDAAIAWFEKARKYAPLNAKDLSDNISILQQQDKYQEAVTIIEENIKQIDNLSKKFKNNASNPHKTDDNTDKNDFITDENLKNTETSALYKPEFRTLFEVMLDMQAHCLKHPSGTVHARKCHFERFEDIASAVGYLNEIAIVEHANARLNALQEIRSHLTSASEETRAWLDWLEADTLIRLSPEQLTPKNAAIIINLLNRSIDLKYGCGLRADMLRCLRQIPQEDVTLWLEKYANMTPDKWMCMALTREAALRAIWLDEEYDTARRVLSKVLIKDDADRRTLWMLEHFSAVAEDWKALGFFREKLAQTETSMRARLHNLKAALAPYIDEELTEHAVRVAQECLKLDAHAFPALVTLAHVAEDNDDIHSLACIADRLAEASAYLENRISYGLWAAQIWSKSLHKNEQAITSLTRLLGQDPACMPAIAMSEQLHIATGKFDQLARIYTRAIAALPEGEEQTELLRKQAHLQAKQLQDAPAATLSLARIIKNNPNDLDAHAMQADLLIQQARWSEAVEIIEMLGKLIEIPEQKRENNLRLADILIHQLEQPDRAKRVLKKHLVQFEHDIKALQLLYDIAWTERNWADAKNTLDEICKDQNTIEARQAQMAFTKVAREAAWPHDVRTMYEKEAIAAVIQHREDFDALVNDYRIHNELHRLIDVAKRELGKQGIPEQIAQYRGCVAALLVANHQHREALAFLSEIIHEAQHTDWAYLARAQALTSAGQLESAIGEYRRTLTRNLNLIDAYEPFIDVLRQVEDKITLDSVIALRDLRKFGNVSDNWIRCIKGSPRGYIDVDHVALQRGFADAQKYLRMMTPYAFEMFSDSQKLTPLEPSHWAYARCHRLFGQNLELKRAYVTNGLKKELCKVRFESERALIFDASILDESHPIAFDFWAGYAMHQAVTGGALIDALNDASVDALFAALCQPKPESEHAQVMKKQLFKLLPRSERKLFKDGVPFLAPAWPEFRKALQTRAACIGAIISACPAYALHARPKDTALETFLISESYVRFVKTYLLSS